MRYAAAWLLVVSVSGLLAACEIIVPGTLSDVHCTEEGAVGPPACPTGMFCAAGFCQSGPPDPGEACAAGGACGPADFCVDPASLGLAGAAFCSRPCCSSADCGDSGAVCAVLGPGKLCVSATMWGRGATGERFAGERCDKSGECRSGVCSSKGHYCVDACCSDAECAAFGAACRGDNGSWTCRPEKPPLKPALDLCDSDDDCTSTLCAEWPDGEKRCAEPCCSSLECGSFKVLDVVRNVLCVPTPHDSAIVLACAAAATGDAEGAVGEPCDVDGQCRGGKCIAADPMSPGGKKICSDVCCTDSSCGAEHLFSCSPVNAGVTGDGAPGSEGQGFDLQCTKR